MTAHPTNLTPATTELAPDLPNEAPWLESSFTETRRLRHDGWDGARMASFCATLAETGVVTEGCRAAGMSAQSAYALRHRDPVFAGAWAAALAMGRERLADDLLARAMKGEVVQVWQNGCIVAEQHRYDNKLALAILRRLDRLAETGATSAAPRRAAGEGTPAAPAATPALNGGWPDLLTALETDRPHEALTLLRTAETDKVDDPPVQPLDAAERAELEQLRARYRDDCAQAETEMDRLDASVWQDEDGAWKTDFPPPADFAGEQDGEWGAGDYVRDCTPQECLLVEEIERQVQEESRAEAEAERDRYFASLAAALEETRGTAAGESGRPIALPSEGDHATACLTL